MQNFLTKIVSGYQELTKSFIVKIALCVLAATASFVLLPFSIGLGIVVIAVFTIFNWNSKYLSILSLVFLSSIPILLYFGYEGIAEEFAVYVYFLLIIVITLELKSYLIENLIKIKEIPVEELFFTKSSVPLLTNGIISTAKTESKKTKPDTSSLIDEVTSKETLEKKVRRYKRGIISWNVVTVGFFAAISWLIFNFDGLPYFRDLQTLPYYFNLTNGNLDLVFFERSLFNELRDLGVSAVTLSNLFYQLIFFSGLCLTYYYLIKIQNIFQEDKQRVYSIFNKVLVLFASLAYVFNPFIFERFLMGQYNVIRGHMLFIPALYYLIKYLQIFEPSHETNDEHALNYFTRFSWVITLLALVSVHHIFFLFGLMIISLVFIFVSKILAHPSHKEEFKYIQKFLTLVSVTVLVAIPSLFILCNRYNINQGAQRSSFETSIRQNRDFKNEIIRAFSPQTTQDNNLVNQTLIGAASWMTPSFTEPEDVRDDLGPLSSISVYFNPLLSWAMIIIFGLLASSLLFQSDKNFKSILFPVIAITPFSLLLTFGYSGGMQVVNQFFYGLPLSYALRESGKFYSLFLGLFALLFVVYYFYQRKTFRYISLFAISVFGLSSLLTFLPLKGNTYYYNLPQAISTNINQTCVEGEKVIFFPFDTYVTTSYLDTFSIYPYRHLTTCEVVIPDKATISRTDKDDLTLYSTDVSEKIDTVVEEYTSSNNTEADYKIFKDQLSSLQIKTIIIDPTHYQELVVLDEYLNIYLENESSDKYISQYNLP